MPRRKFCLHCQFHGQIPSHSGNIKKFPLGWWCKFTSMKFQETADHNTWYKIFWQPYCHNQILFITIKSFQLRQFTNPIWPEVDVNTETPLISSMSQNYTVISATLFKKPLIQNASNLVCLYQHFYDISVTCPGRFQILTFLQKINTQPQRSIALVHRITTLNWLNKDI